MSHHQELALSDSWTFTPGVFTGAAKTSYSQPAISGVNPGQPWQTQAALAKVEAGTFRYELTLPDTLVDYGLRIPAFYGAYRVYIDGRYVGGRGTPSLAEAGQEDYVASEVIALPRRQQVNIALEAASYNIHPGGAATFFNVAPYMALKSTEDRVLGLTLFVVGLLTAIGFTVLATAWGSPVTRRQRAFGGLATSVAGFVALNDTGLLAAQWLVVPYAVIYRAQCLFLYVGMALVWEYAAVAGGIKGGARFRKTLTAAMIAAAVIALCVPIKWSSQILPYAYVPMTIGTLYVGCQILVGAGWRRRSVLLSRLSLFALASGMTIAAVAEIGVDQGLGFLALGSFLAFGVAGAAQFIRELVSIQGGLLAEVQVSEVKSQFMARVSHELRTPLHGIKSLTHLLDKGEHDPARCSLLSALATSATAMESTVAKLLDYEEVRSGKLSVELRAANLSTIVQEAAAVAKLSLSPERNLILRNDSGVDLITTDATRLRDVFVELLHNAIAHGGDEAPVMTVEREELNVLITVRSGGEVLSPEAVRSAFEPFGQRQNYWERSAGGLGLGLPVALAIVERLGGTLLHQAVERGNAFEVRLPVAEIELIAAATDMSVRVQPSPKELLREPQQPSNSFEILAERSAVISDGQALAQAALATAALDDIEAQPITLGLAPRTLRILIVEDHPINQLLARRMVEGWGHQADVAENGQLAIDAVVPAKYDLILMDLQMPVLDGLSATRKLRETFSAADLPIIALTANTSTADRKACSAAGMQGFLSKPFRADELRRIIDDLSAHQSLKELPAEA